MRHNDLRLHRQGEGDRDDGSPAGLSRPSRDHSIGETCTLLHPLLRDSRHNAVDSLLGAGSAAVVKHPECDSCLTYVYRAVTLHRTACLDHRRLPADGIDGLGGGLHASGDNAVGNDIPHRQHAGGAAMDFLHHPREMVYRGHAQTDDTATRPGIYPAGDGDTGSLHHPAPGIVCKEIQLKKMINPAILKALLRKEVLLMRRNPIVPKIILMMPLMVMLVVPLVANLDVKNVNVAVVDNDRSQLSRRIISDIGAAQSLSVSAVCQIHSEAISMVEKGDADVLLTIPPDYSRNLATDRASVDVEANGVNATRGMLGARYVSQSVVGTLHQWQSETGRQTAASGISIINRYNPTLNFHNYMIPALMVVLLIIICGFLPTLNLVSEKESGTIEAINVTPVSRFTFVLSKLIPFWVVGLLVVTVGMLVGWLVYGLVPQGNIGVIYLAAILFSLVMSGLGVSIANRSATMLQSIFVMFAFIIIFQLMSGLFTPISSMPEWAQALTYAIPPRYFIEIMRSVYLKGTSLSELLPQFCALAAFAAILCLLAALSYKKRS